MVLGSLDLMGGGTSQAGMNVESEWLLKLAAISQGAAPIINVAGTYDEKGETGRSLRGITIKQVSAF